MKNLAVLINSCDAYNDLWNPFFTLFSKYGGKLKELNIYLNTETKQYSFDGINIICINKPNGNGYWGERLKECLLHIKEAYVLVFLEDFFIREPVNCDRIFEILKRMESDKTISAFNFDPNISGGKDDFKGFSMTPIGVKWRINAQVAIWRKEDLYNSILDIETPWQWEEFGTPRYALMFPEKKIYAIIDRKKAPVQYGLIEKPGGLVIKGKWVKDQAQKIFKDNDIAVDFSFRGEFIENNSEIEINDSKCRKKNALIEFIKNKTAPLRKKLGLIKPSEYETLTKRFVQEPIKQYKKGNKNWDRIQY